MICRISAMSSSSGVCLLLLLLAILYFAEQVTCSRLVVEDEDIGVCQQLTSNGSYVPTNGIPDSDADNILVALNLEYLECEFFLYAVTGEGLDSVEPSLAGGGPSPIGPERANLDALTGDIIYQFALQEIGHLRAIKQTIPDMFPRVQLDLRKEVFSSSMEAALGTQLQEPFNPYNDSLSFLLASYLIPYVGLTGYVGAIPNLQSERSKRLVAGLLAVESGQDAVVRTLLYQRKDDEVPALSMKVSEVTNKLSELRNKLGGKGNVDEGLEVSSCLGAEGKVTGNSLAGDNNSVGYARTPAEIFRIVYGSGNESVPGGFYPQGCKGRFAESFLAPNH
ncbi:hypothetical protein KP509_19G026500 [Ceratopteris richardii]|uniref:Desiccation-related protein PCC13-62 n=1 Tax=Ceratopteris richardii TaxID=49495 RepID=A0A8T2SMW8_CERRI|nr:hypothetical protein KP509_19G026500 [Ceratopteris richardii]